MAGIWQHRIVFAVQMGENIRDWFDLPCVDGIRKDDKGGLIVYLKDVVRSGLLCEGISLAPIDNSWLCRDEEDRWWLLGQAEYAALDEERHVMLHPRYEGLTMGTVLCKNCKHYSLCDDGHAACSYPGICHIGDRKVGYSPKDGPSNISLKLYEEWEKMRILKILKMEG